MSFRLLIADRDPEMSSIISSELKSESSEIRLIHDGYKLLQAIKSEEFNLLVMDVVLPELSGIHLLEEIRKIRTVDSLAILILSEPLDDEMLAQYIEVGANDFLFKPYRRGQLISRVRALQSRFLPKDAIQAQASGQYEYGHFRLNIHSSDFYQGDFRTHLTPSEFKLLEALFRHRGTILTRDQLIEEVQGAGVVVVDRAIDTHVFSLRKKLGDHASLIETVRGVGYRISHESMERNF
jgi:two-component system, OmpR family, phosphate regulon response regulator PhoB